ncbi:MAG: hypothetical protein HGA70_10310 [Chlorobiaceae bacterium]|nr:hypothetical protein [Chlorobiaceae bacterium]NTW10678.1 hypothetical protein [Chlorobiaceae bacterium]
MKIFKDIEEKKRFMKAGLPYILGFAWTPILWILFIAVLGPVLFVLTGSWLAVQLLVLVLAIIVVNLLLKLFRRYNFRFYGDRKEDGSAD